MKVGRQTVSGAVFVGRRATVQCLMDGRGRDQFNPNSSKDQRICKIPFDFPRQRKWNRLLLAMLSFGCLVGWLAGWLISWLVGWLTDWLAG